MNKDTPNHNLNPPFQNQMTIIKWERNYSEILLLETSHQNRVTSWRCKSTIKNKKWETYLFRIITQKRPKCGISILLQLNLRVTRNLCTLVAPQHHCKLAWWITHNKGQLRSTMQMTTNVKQRPKSSSNVLKSWPC